LADLYETDVALWSERQADLLRRMGAGERVNDQMDWRNVADEIADVAKRDRDRVYGALATALTRLLKWQFQPEMRSSAWRSAVVKARERISKVMRDSTSLRGYPATVLGEAYSAARRVAEAESGIADLPSVAPWTIEQVLDHAFWPGPPA
jgi:Domain of unknown function DUF29